MRCKRCGSVLSYEDAMCKGCGRSLSDLKAQNEIEFDDNATVSVEPIKQPEAPKHVEEPKVEDIFGDAIYKEENSQNILKEDNSVVLEGQPNVNLELNNSTLENNKNDVEQVNAEPLNVEQINTEPLKVESVTTTPKIEELNVEPLDIEKIEIEELNNNPIEQGKVDDSSNKLVGQEKTKNQEMSNEFVSKKKSKKGIIIVIVALVVLVIAAILGYFFFKTNPKGIFESGVNKLFSYANLKLASSPITKDEVYLKVNIDDSKQNGVYDILNNLSFNLKSNFDKTNKNLMISLDSKYDNSDLLGITIYGSDNKIYGLLNNIYEKYIGYPVPIDVYNKIFEDTDYLGEIQIILTELNKEINSSFDKKYFSRSIKGTDVIAIFSLDKNGYVDFSKSLLTKVKNNDKLVNGLASLTGKQTNELKQNIDTEIANFNDGLDNVKIEITSSILDGKVKNVKVMLNDKTDKVELNIDVVGTSNYNFTLKANDITSNGALNIKDINDFKEYSFTIDDNEIGKVTYTIGYKFSSDGALTLPDLSNSVDYDQMEESELETILTGLFQNEGIMKLYEAFSSLENENTDDVMDNNVYYTETDGIVTNTDGNQYDYPNLGY